jgi:trans-aconitate 2-methyltransferase
MFRNAGIENLLTNLPGNMNKNDWNPDQYLKFNKERIQPSIDLVARIGFFIPGRIIDIGCGPGNSTQILHNRWPEAEITGADNSPAMIKKAMEDYPDQKWILYDAGKDTLNEKFDLVFSNATIQWIPDHNNLLQRFAGLLNDNGVLAVQLPLFFDMPVGKALSDIGKDKRWRASTEGVDSLFTINTVEYYYDRLVKNFSNTDIWISDYYHVMESQYSIMEMIRTTGLKPYLERLSDENDKKQFELLLFERIRQDYEVQEDGKTLFPFKRLFFIAKK